MAILNAAAWHRIGWIDWKWTNEMKFDWFRSSLQAVEDRVRQNGQLLVLRSQENATLPPLNNSCFHIDRPGIRRHIRLLRSQFGAVRRTRGNRTKSSTGTAAASGQSQRTRAATDDDHQRCETFFCLTAARSSRQFQNSIAGLE